MPARSHCRKPRILRSLASAAIESLEFRTLFNATVTSTIGAVTSTENASATTIDLTQHFKDPTITGTAVVMHTSQGDIPLNLFISQTPQTVANFQSYVDSGAYDNTVIHRAIPGFLIQGGTYLTDQSDMPTPNGAVPSEAGISNTLGTIAAALNGGPGTATGGWFINDGNNSTALDGSSDGGPFTVFGQVVYTGPNRGMNVVNQIANLPKGIVQPTFTPDTSLGDPSGGVLPLQNYSGGTITTANYVTITSIQEIPSGLAFAATSSNTSLVVPTISDGTLSLSYQPNQTGIASITVTATDLGGNAVSQTFEVAVGTVLGSGGAKQIRFTDADGTRTTLTLTGPGTANIQLNGTVASNPITKAGVMTVTGSDLSIAGISLTGTTAASTLNVTGVGGNGLVEIGSITSDGALRTINATRGALSGDLTVAGTVSRIALESAAGGTITLNGTSGAATLAIPAATGETVTSTEPIALLQSTSWLAPTGSVTPSSLTAPAIVRIISPHEFDAQVTAASVATANVGAINDSTWTISGSVGSLNAALIAGLTINAGSVGRLTDRGTASDLNINSAGNIALVSATALIGSNIFAGQPTYPPVPPLVAVYPSLPTGFATDQSIATVRMGAGGFSNSQIGAASLGNLTLGKITTSAGGSVFGVAAGKLSLLTATIDGNRLTLRNPASESDVTTAEDKAGITPNDLEIQIV